MIAGILLLIALPLLPESLDEGLLSASRIGDADKAAVLLRAGANLDSRHSLTGWTALMIACFHGHIDTVKVLLQAGADPNAVDKRGGTPLMKAVAVPAKTDPGLLARRVEILKVLLAGGADPQKKDSTGGTAWQTAMALDENEFVEVFAAEGVRGVRETQLMEAIALGNEAVVNSLISAGADVNYRDDAGWSALSEAALAGNAAFVKTVLAHGAEVNSRFEKGWTALMIAARENHADAVRELLAAGADRTLRSDDGPTALDIAIASGSIDCAQILQQ